jgi:hypothetical protein
MQYFVLGFSLCIGICHMHMFASMYVCTYVFMYVCVNREQSSNLLLALASTFLVSDPFRTHDHLYVCSKATYVLKWGLLLFDEKRGSDYYCRLPPTHRLTVLSREGSLYMCACIYYEYNVSSCVWACIYSYMYVYVCMYYILARVCV